MKNIGLKIRKDTKSSGWREEKRFNNWKEFS